METETGRDAYAIYARGNVSSGDTPPQRGRGYATDRPYVGYMADLVERLAEIVGFDYDIRPVQDGSFGYQRRRDGAWDGVIGELVSKVGGKGVDHI